MKKFRKQLHNYLFSTETPTGKIFNGFLFGFIILSVIMVVLESVQWIHQSYTTLFNYVEWFITILFSIEYAFRIFTANKPFRYIFSFYGLIDLVSIVPKFISLFLIGPVSFDILRTLRLFRVFRILKITRHWDDFNKLLIALYNSLSKILVFLFAVIVLSIIFGAIMYIVEGNKSGFTSIPVSIYWCIVTLTTVGYGDIHPTTPLGQFIAATIMVLSYAIIAVPTGIISVEYMRSSDNVSISTNLLCPNCWHESHQPDAQFCHHCGEPLGHDEE